MGGTQGLMPIGVGKIKKYKVSISFIPTGDKGREVDVDIETDPDIFLLSPKARRREILCSPTLLAFAEALRPWKIRGIPTLDELIQERNRMEDESGRGQFSTAA